MTKKPKTLSPLAEATLALDEKLERFEDLAAAAQRIPLNSQKNIERAAVAINESADCQNEVLAHIHALIQVLNAARDRNQATAAVLQTRGEAVQKRNDELGALLVRFAALGQAAKDISGAVTPLRGNDADNAGAREGAVAELAQVDARMGEISAQAVELATAANEAELSDLAQQADSLRQQIASARNKVNLLLKKLEERKLALS